MTTDIEMGLAGMEMIRFGFGLLRLEEDDDDGNAHGWLNQKPNVSCFKNVIFQKLSNAK